MCSYFFLFKKTLLLRITRHILNFEVSECVSTKQEQHTPCTRTVLRLLSLLVVQEQPSWPAEESTLTKQRQTERAPTSSQTRWKSQPFAVRYRVPFAGAAAAAAVLQAAEPNQTISASI